MFRHSTLRKKSSLTFDIEVSCGPLGGPDPVGHFAGEEGPVIGAGWVND